MRRRDRAGTSAVTTGRYTAACSYLWAAMEPTARPLAPTRRSDGEERWAGRRGRDGALQWVLRKEYGLNGRRPSRFLDIAIGTMSAGRASRPMLLRDFGPRQNTSWPDATRAIARQRTEPVGDGALAKYVCCLHRRARPSLRQEVARRLRTLAALTDNQ
jgi:hypothetical protein